MSKKLLFNLNKNVSQDYTYVKYTGTIVTATNTLEKPIKNAILKGDTKYRDVDTGEILDSFDGTKNLELVSVKMPVLQTYDGNIMRLSPPQHTTNNVTIEKINDVEFLFNQGGRQGVGGWKWSIPNGEAFTLSFDYEKVSGCENQCQIHVWCAGGIADKTDLSEQFGQFEKTYYVKRTTPTAVEFKPVGELTSTKSVLKISNLKWYIGNKVYSDKTNILTTPKDFELKGLADVKDTLDCNTGEYVERIKEVVLNGETTSNGSTSTDGYIGDYATHLSKLVDGKNEKLYFQGFVGNFGNSKDYILTNGFAQYKGFRPNDSELEEGLYRYKGDNHAYICISASRFTDHTFKGVKRFLNENPQSYLVTNKGVTTKTVDLSILDQDENTVTSISSFNDTTHIITSSDTIPPIFEGYIATKESVE